MNRDPSLPSLDDVVAHVNVVASQQLERTLEPGAMLHVLVYAVLRGERLESPADVDVWLAAHTGLEALRQPPPEPHGSVPDGRGDTRRRTRVRGASEG